MNNSRLALLLFSFFLWTSLATAEDAKPYVQAQRSLAMNRSLLSRAESEHAALLKQESAEPTEAGPKRLDDLRYKIQALRDDATRLSSALPKAVGADEFLKDLTAPAAEGGHRKPVDIQRERRIARSLEDVYAMHEKALGLVAQDHFGDAAKVYEEILLLSPDDDEAYLLLGHCRLLNGEYEQARDAFLNAVHIDGTNRREITGLYENVLLSNPQDSAAYAHLGFAHGILGNIEEAQKAFHSALQIDPNNAEAKAGMASTVPIPQ